MSVKIEPGIIVYSLDETFEVEKVIDFDTIQVSRKRDGKLFTLKIKDVSFHPPEQMRDTIQNLNNISKEELEQAEARLAAIQPVLNARSRRAVEKRAQEVGVSANTIYNWIRAYESTGQLSSLVFRGNRGGKGRSRLDPHTEEIIKSTINEMFSGLIYPTAQKVWEEIGIKCKNANLPIPSIASIRRRVRKHKEQTSMKVRRKKDPMGLIKSEYPDGLFPLHVIQIDHTQVDVILVDSKYRTELGRPWITLAIDAYSRMITGYYISFESPGYFGVGQAIQSSVLPKRHLIDRYDLKSEWPVYGIPQFVHADNAKEFRGMDIKRVCREYEINLIWRPVKRPHFGGYIERMVRTLNESIHTLEGSTMSNIFERGESDPQKDAVLTLEEFEEWLLIEIVDKYHNKKHSSLGMSPLEKYREGIFGGSNTPPRGLPPVIMDEYKFKLNLLPSEPRTIQRYGIRIDNITYHSDALEGWINAIEPNSNPPVKKVFEVRRDPRDISVIYVYDDIIDEFIEVPYANAQHPPTSLWEFRAALKSLKEQEERQYDEHEIFMHIERQKEIVEQAKKTTKKQRKNIQREHTRSTMQKSTTPSPEIISPTPEVSSLELDDLEGFDIEDNAELVRIEPDPKEEPLVHAASSSANTNSDEIPF